MVSVALSGFFCLFVLYASSLKNHGIVLQHMMLLDFSSLIMYKEFQPVKSGPFTEITDL